MKCPVFFYHMLLVVLLALMCSCSGSSSSSIAITGADKSSDSAVTGQRLYFQVSTVVDYPVAKYIWRASGGTIEDKDNSNNKNYIFWISPEEPGTYTVTCTIIDDEGNVKAAPFSVDVSSRSTKLLLSQDALGMAKEDGVKIGGVWVSTQHDTRYYSFAGNTNISWGYGYDLIAVQNTYDQSTYTYITLIWAAKTGENSLIYYNNGMSESTTFNECSKMTRLVMDKDKNVLLIGADNGLFAYYPHPTDLLITTSVDSHVYDIKVYDSGALVATKDGLYKVTYNDTWTSELLYNDNDPTYAVLKDTDGNIWRVIDSNGAKVITCEDTALAEQPPEVVDSLDQDLLGHVWCGKYYWDGDSWHDPTGITDEVKQSMISPEGLAYIITTSGELFSW